MNYLQLFIEFFKIGLFTFGGGYAMLPLISDVVSDYGWLTNRQLIDFIAVSESTPGPFAVNISTYIGIRTGGLAGACMATFGVVLPSFIIILLVARCYEKFCKSSVVMGALTGLKPAVIALIATAILSIAGNVFEINNVLTMKNASMLFIVAVASVMSYRKFHPILIICISGMLGIVSGLTGML